MPNKVSGDRISILTFRQPKKPHAPGANKDFNTSAVQIRNSKPPHSKIMGVNELGVDRPAAEALRQLN